MKIIDLYVKIANGEEVPYRIRYLGEIYEYVEEMKWYLRDDMKCELSNSKKCLNDEVEIIEEPKGIPEKLDDILRIDDLEPPYDDNLDKIWCQTIKNQNKINEILDYLKSKGND